MRFLSVVALSAALAAVATAFPIGAGTCLSNATIIQAGGGGAMGKVANLGFTLSVGLTDTYTPGDTKPVSIKVQGGMQFKGILIYAVDSNKQHVGQWIPSVGTHFKEGCMGEPNATLTHSSPTPKGPEFGLLWIPPAQSAGDIFFTGALVTGPQTGFQIVKSSTFKSSTGAAAASAAPAAPATQTTAIGDSWNNSTSTSYGMSVPAATPTAASPVSTPATSPTGAPSTGGGGASGQVQFQTVTALDPSVSAVVATATAGALVPNLAANEAPSAATTTSQISLTSGAGRSGAPVLLQQLMIAALSVKFLLAFL